ncbi:hypothetical protein [Streptomyces candidus]|uniref:Cys-tRNA synthase (O-phospho-L-seryl-tRNA:Cys-tRNA synthase) n=1 Tax=Streptomyces candidus TaxID=67283 RepID=A0A7X0HMN5_9ACTN|nr:hypothetical protein [Streptomyces candidus]MBB6440253.1 Cys-tRNA synthase (O-phospho-L-seryl-tRNA:Cys-tRNA synthase) [Streptomyces candidus]GHH58141.1 hypothetical protein GCM10018773_66210 [Streptomyces candidus]
MSVRFTITCDRMSPHGGCPSQIVIDARTIDDAYIAAEAQGWQINEVPDHCPCCVNGPETTP